MQNLETFEIFELLSMVREGSDEAFSELVRRYTPMMNKLVSGFACTAVRSDEAFCEACVAFYRAAMTYDTERTEVTFGLYARICVYRRLCDLAGKEMRREELFSELDIDTVAVSSGIEAALVGKEMMKDTLKKIKAILSKYEYDVFLLYLQGFTTAAISEKLDKPAKSVDNAKARLFRRIRNKTSGNS